MPWKLLFIMLCVVFATVFIGFNLENTCNVSLFGIHTFEHVPVFMSILIAFSAGILLMFPFTFGKNRKKQTGEKISEPKTEKNSRTAAHAKAAKKTENAARNNESFDSADSPKNEM